MPIYTKKGDKGTTGTFAGKRVPKSSQLIKTIGAIDELNSLLGVVEELTDIQSDLFTINAILTGAKLKLSEDAAKKLEKEIDRLERILPAQKNFIYYGGDPKAALLFFTRAIARRAERNLVSLSKEEKVPDSILIYFNRLSDYLFIKAREINFKSGFKEKAWRG